MQIIHRISLVSSALLALGALGLGCQNQVLSGDGENDGNAHQGAIADKGSAADKGDPANDKGCGGGPNDPGPGGGPNDPGCTVGIIGDGMSCQDSSLLKQQAWDLCQQAGLMLTNLGVNSDGCSGGDFSIAKYECCPQPPAPPPKDPGPGCTGGIIGDGMSCQDSSLLKQQAWDLCQQAGLMLTNLGVNSDGCSGGDFSIAKYECCPEPPAPPPTPCTGGIIGDGTTCQDYGAVKQQASDICAQTGAVLTDLGGDGSGCPDGQWAIAKYACCGPGPTPDPCTYTKVGDGVTCQDESALNQQAADACAAIGLPLTAAKLGFDCPNGQSSWGEVACCP